jgi:hypothetical protein
MLLIRILTSLSAASSWLFSPIHATPARGAHRLALNARQAETDGYQNIVTWDEYSLMIHGERLFIFSGEVNPSHFSAVKV